MTPVFVVDTNVIVSAMVGSDPKSPPAQVLEPMLDGSLLYLMSGDLLTEYASVLRRPASHVSTAERMPRSTGCSRS
ncbi:PIN domain-containing protein [Candidatus Palauibacter sp.]|uniref:PIN domain-containing protein n=1 Tax=Candidatus Palauibacter sp. TaxID=3101350 RepID=UPI003AF2525B